MTTGKDTNQYLFNHFILPDNHLGEFRSHTAILITELINRLPIFS